MVCKKVLIATRNSDKLDMVKQFLARFLGWDFEFVGLRELGITDDTEEIGSISERAMGKAAFLVGRVPSEIDYILGIDDGIEVRSVVTAETKKMVDKILPGDYLDKGEVVSIVRAFAIIDVSSGKSNSVMTKIPFKYLGSESEVKREEGKYPLNFVLGRLDGSNSLVDDDKDERHNYSFKYSGEGLKKLFDLID